MNPVGSNQVLERDIPRKQIMKGNFNEFTLDEVVHVIGLSRQALRLEISSSGAELATVDVKSGQVLAARTPTGLNGVDVFAWMLKTIAPGSMMRLGPLGALVDGALHRDPDLRFPTARELLDALLDLDAEALEASLELIPDRRRPLGGPTEHLPRGPRYTR